jgi:hypothetical protein
MRRHTLAWASIILIAGATTADERSAPGIQIQNLLLVGAGAEAHGYCGLCVLDREGVPIACFGLNKRPNEKTLYAYLLLFKTPATQPGGGVGTADGKGVSTNFSLDTEATVMFNGKKVAVGYRFTADEKTNTLTSETVKLGGEAVKPDAPRIHLVDLTRQKVTFVPVRGEVAVEVPDLTDPDQKTWAKSVDRAIEQLKEKSPEVKKFLE